MYAAKNNKNLKKFEKNTKKNESKKIKAEAFEEYILAGKMFEKINCFRQAAQCYYTAKNYTQAAELFIKQDLFAQAAECFMITRDFLKAAKMFEESNLVLRSLECYEYLQDWEGVLLCLNRNKDQFKEAERESLINKYVPIALNSIFRMLNINEVEHNKGKEVEEKYVAKIPKIIEEESDIESEGEELEDEDDNQLEQPEKKPTVPEEKQVNLVDSDNEEVKSVEAEESDKEEVITTETKKKFDEASSDLKHHSPQKDKGLLSDHSFSVISKADLEDNFEHLSNFDPEDEFLSGGKSFSIVGSLIANDKKSLADYSEYSILSDSRVSSIVNTNAIQTNRDIYIEDVAMQKIIYYVSLFSDDTRRYLQKLRSKDQLFQAKEGDFGIDEFELELDNIDIELVKVLLDVLENFDMYRLCMIVCNRYNVKDRLFRYLTSLCYKYSNLRLINSEVLKINNPLFRQNQQQVSLLANEAIHNMFSLVSPDMIRQAKTENIPEEEKMIKIKCWRFLFYLGFWKKLTYLVDSMTSLKLSFTTGDIKNFKIVYLLHYREGLTNEQIIQFSNEISSAWIDQGAEAKLDKRSELGILCYKVLIEEISKEEVLDTSITDPDLECNITLNKWLKQSEKEKESSKDQFLKDSLKKATDKLRILMGAKASMNQVALFDLSLYFGRVFAFSSINYCVSKCMDRTKNPEIEALQLKCSMFTVCSTLVSLLEDPLRFHSLLDTTDIHTICQGLLLPFKVRIPENSGLFLNLLPFVLMNRNSHFVSKDFESFYRTYKNDRSNKELIEIYSKEVDFHISKTLLHHAVKNHMASFDKFGAGICYDFYGCGIADIDAEYIRVPKSECLTWFKKNVVGFLSRTVLREDESGLYSTVLDLKSDLINEVLPSEELLQDYKTAVSVSTLHTGILNSKDIIEQSFKSRDKMVANVQDAKYAAEKCMLPPNYVKNAQLLNKESNLLIDRRVKSKSEQLLTKSTSLMRYIEGIQLNRLFTDSLEFGNLLNKAIESFKKSKMLLKQNSSDFGSKVYKACCILARINKLEIAEEVLKTYKNDKLKPNKTDFTDSVISSIQSYNHFINGIEKFQNGLWFNSAQAFHTFLNNSFSYFDYDIWIRNFERAWYLAIVNHSGYQEGVYIPINALNYVHEEAHVPQNTDIDPHCMINYFERQLDLQTVTDNDLNQFLTTMLKTFKKAYDHVVDQHTFKTKVMLQSIFNMIGTLITNFGNISNSLLTQIKVFVDIMGESEYIDEENVNKFYEYFGDKQAIANFRVDFLDISDEEKNDTLYFDMTEGAQNQYFVHLLIRPESQNRNERVIETYQRYIEEKCLKMVVHKRLANRLRNLLRNVKLARKTININKQKQDLSDCHTMWLTYLQETRITETLKALCQHVELRDVVAEVEKTLNRLYNIFNSHYTIKNSFDIHFIAESIERLDNTCTQARVQLEGKLKELEAANNQNEESFNPFIEIGDNQEENKFVDVFTDLIKEAVKEVADELRANHDEVWATLTDWLSRKSSPELLNLQTQQANLKHKLKWEKMYNAKEKLMYLKKALRTIRKKK